MTKVLATWVGPYDAKLPDGTLLEPGVTEVEVGIDEARDSDNWRPKGTIAPRQAPTPAPAPDTDDDKAGE